ncbi:putative flippase GtrA [Actinoplanes octamycinicus]|uniref:Putative flippase GtrA n=1 Tax=Actinoplanes octamycinicus TaxID=135948 RepID=A0A7W7GXD7_9ACTN|nr:GtrA family protein [Actinoplanes octamycinicus]MBB4740039.1 putative flippase GtrA [Actinoplanes octamycinicus]GIE59433.1 hypothetical protein Aoc01nite_48350 [Actinoplanes octamycinicus]
MPSPSGRLARPPAWNATVPRQLLWFMLVGALSTVLQTIVYVSVREVVAATWASWLALLVVTPVNTEAHRRITFNVTTSAIARLHWEAGLTSVVVYLANLAASPWFAAIAGPHPSALTESLILALTGSLVGGARYLILRSWVFAARRHTPATPAPALAEIPGAAEAGATLTTAPEAGVTAVATEACVTAVATEAGVTTTAATEATVTTPPDRRNAVSRRPRRFRPNSAPATAATEPKPQWASSAEPGTTGEPFSPTTFPAFPTTGNISAALACLGTLAPIPTARLCTSHGNTGVLNQRPPGRLRTWHRNRRQHLTARS